MEETRCGTRPQNVQQMDRSARAIHERKLNTSPRQNERTEKSIALMPDAVVPYTMRVPYRRENLERSEPEATGIQRNTQGSNLKAGGELPFSPILTAGGNHPATANFKATRHALTEACSRWRNTNNRLLDQDWSSLMIPLAEQGTKTNQLTRTQTNEKGPNND